MRAAYKKATDASGWNVINSAQRGAFSLPNKKATTVARRRLYIRQWKCPTLGATYNVPPART